MKQARKLFSPAARRKIERLIKVSPSPALARTNLTRLSESSGARAFHKIPSEHLPALFRLLGGSAYLSDILIREGRGWPDLFLRQIRTERKTTADHLAELTPALKQCASADELARLLRRHKQKEYLRIGARDLSPAVSVEETTRELSTLAEAALETAYRFCRLEVEKDFGRLCLPGSDKENRFVVLGMGKLGGEELNFSSDIDLIYLYEEDEGRSAGGRKGKSARASFFTAWLSGSPARWAISRKRASSFAST